jgi:hypothetical protein
MTSLFQNNGIKGVMQQLYGGMNGGQARSSKYTPPDSFGTMASRESSSSPDISSIIKAMGSKQTGQGLQSLITAPVVAPEVSPVTPPAATTTDPYASMQGWAAPGFLDFLKQYRGNSVVDNQMTQAQQRYDTLLPYRNQGIGTLTSLLGNGDYSIRRNAANAIAMLGGTYNPNAKGLL